MTIPLIGAGGLFTRLGHLWGGVSDSIALEGAAATARVLAGASMTTRESTWQTDYGAGTADLELINGDNGFGLAVTPLYQAVDTWNTVFNQLFQSLQTVAGNTIIKMGDRDNNGLSQRTLPFALTYLINQMNLTIAPPAAPGLSTATTGGTILAGTYTVAVSYTSAFGETLASATATVTTTGSTSTITITSPSTLTGATGWFAYVSQVGGTTLTRQQAAGSPTAIGTNLTLTAPPTNTGNAPPSTNTAIASTVNATTISVGAQTASGTPIGNPIIVLSSLNGLGQVLQYPNSETLTFQTTQDAQTGGATARQELMTVTGQAAITSVFSFQWPAGSAVSQTLNLCDSLVSNQGTALNGLQNSSFETYTNANVPDNWTIATGTAGTQVVSGGAANAYKGVNSVGFVGDSATNTAITQLLNQTPNVGIGAGGSPFQPLPQTNYCVNLWYKLSVVSPTAGVLAVDLIDGLGNIINDSSNTANTVSVNLHNVANTNFNNLNAVFRLPAVRPAQVKLRIRLSTPLTTGTTVYVDDAALNTMKQLYAGGPFASGFSGNVNTIKNDTWTFAFTVTAGAVQQYCQRFFAMTTLGLQLPAATSSPTVADTVIA